MCGDTMQYDLSVAALLLVCELCSKNVMIFGARGSLLQFRGGVLGHGIEEPVLVALNEGTIATRVRGHFQRLISTEHLAQLESEQAIARAKQTQSCRKKAAMEREEAGVRLQKPKVSCRQGTVVGEDKYVSSAARPANSSPSGTAGSADDLMQPKDDPPSSAQLRAMTSRLDSTSSAQLGGLSATCPDTSSTASRPSVGQAKRMLSGRDESADTCHDCGASPFRGLLSGREA